jgi:hypothetical protein
MFIKKVIDANISTDLADFRVIKGSRNEDGTLTIILKKRGDSDEKSSNKS